MNRIRLATVGALLLTLSSASGARAQFEEAAKWALPNTNTIVLIRAREILNSPYGKARKWHRHSNLFETGFTFGPGHTERIMIASQMDYDFMEPQSTVCVFEKHGTDLDLIDISKQTGGILDEIDGRRAVMLPSDTYLVPLDDQTLGALYPANRQVVAQWLRTRRNAAMDLSPYLTTAVKYADQNAHIIMAMDLADAVHPGLIREQLQGVCEKDSMDEVCDSVCSLKGITLGITITDAIHGALKVDFSGSTAPFAAQAKQLVLSALKKNGLMIDDLESWEVQVGPAQILMSGGLTDSGLRKIASIAQHPMLLNIPPSSAMEREVDVKTRSLQYFHDIEKILDDIQGRKSSSLATYAYWYSRYARMIDELPSRGVDPELLQYGLDIANRLRAMTGILREANYSRVSERSNYSVVGGTYGGYGGTYGIGLTAGGYGYGYGRYGYYSNNYGVRARQIVGGLEKLKGFDMADEIMRQIDAETAKIRHKMSQKYDTDF